MTKSFKTMMLAGALLGSMSAAAGPPGRVRDANENGIPDRFERGAKRARMMYVVAIAEALELSEADALKMAEKVKAIEERRQPVRQAMHQAMQAVRAAADGDAAALADVDANIQSVLDGRAQMAAMDKELFQYLSKDLPPLKKAKLALVLAKLGPAHGMKGRMGGPE